MQDAGGQGQGIPAMRFSLKTVLLLTALVAVTFVGALYPNRTWAAAFYTGTLLAILSASVVALVGSGVARAYWTGFAVFAGGYFIIAMLGDTQLQVTETSRIPAWNEPRLITSQLLLWVDDRLTRFRPERAKQHAIGATYMRAGYSPMTFLAVGPTGQTIIIGHSLLAVLIGLIGGIVARLTYRNGCAQKSATEPRSQIAELRQPDDMN
jgi:hypothetical protein